MKELKFYNKDRGGKSRQCGSMMIKNQTDTSADLYFYGDIASETWQSDWYEEDMAPGDVKEFLDELTGTEKINIHINSGGGSVFGGIAIYNMLKRNDAYKTVYIDGLAASIPSHSFFHAFIISSFFVCASPTFIACPFFWTADSKTSGAFRRRDSFRMEYSSRSGDICM